MSKPGEAIELKDFDADDDEYIDDDDDEYESTVGDTTGAVGGTPTDSNFGGEQIQTPADQRRKGSIGWEENDITQEDIDNMKKLTKETNNEEELTHRLRELSGDRIPNFDANLLKEQLLIDNILEINTKLSTLWKVHVEKLGNKFELEGGVMFKSGTKWSLTDEGVFVEYKGKNKTRLTAAGNPRKFLKPSTISKNYGRGGTSFLRNVLGVVDYSSASKKHNNKLKKHTFPQEMFHS